MTTTSWKEVAAKKQESVLASIPKKWRVPGLKKQMTDAGYLDTKEYLDTILPKEELEITSLTVIELSKEIAAGHLTAYQTAEAFCHRAALTHQILNCCVEIFFDKALESAKKLDEEFAKTGKTIGPLHGVPISLKDQVDIPGLPSSIGYIAFAETPKTEMSLLASTLKDMGAIFYVKTTVPMAMMSSETNTNLMGYTYNARNINLSSGGSSGGEGALIGAGASPLGFGTDIGGSIRFPACFQGIYGFKPSVGRFSYLNVYNSYEGQEVAPSVIGPMSSSLDDIAFVSKLLLSSGFWKKDPKVLQIPWRDESELDGKKFTYGVITDSGTIKPQPPMLRGIDDLTHKLEKAGHEVVPIRIPFHADLINTLDEIFAADLGHEIFMNCKKSGEPVMDHLCLSTGDGSVMDVNSWWALSDKADKLRVKFWKFWDETTPTLTKSGKPIDAIISPVSISTSFIKGKKASGTTDLMFTGPFNLTDCCSIVVPISKVNGSTDVVPSDFKPRNEAEAFVYDMYDPELFDQMPVCIQVVAKKSQEEKVIKFATAVRDAL